MDYRDVPADTCPLCKTRSLAWSGTTCTCRSCGSAFELSPDTRRCHYVHVAPEYAAAAPALVSDWLTRREVFERVEAVLPAPQPSSQTAISVPMRAIWGVLVGALALIPILCACLSALLLSPGIMTTRRMIAIANAPTATPTQTMVVGSITATQLISPVDALQSPVLTPTALNETPATTETMTEPTATEAGGEQPGELPTLPPIITVEIVTSTTTTEVGTQIPASQSPLPSPTEQPAQNPSPTTPATFTVAPQPTAATAGETPTLTPNVVATVTAQPGSTATAATATPTLTPTATPTTTVVATLTATPTSTLQVSVQVSSSVVISYVMYSGTTGINQADQYVEIQNRGTNAVNIGLWTLTAVSTSSEVEFSNGLVIQPNQVCRVYTNSAFDYGGCGALSFFKPYPVWSNVRDVAELRDSSRNLIGKYEYTVTE
ncbi:MAG: lamin tail domain-containing protein [Chloroflexi bacterium]|nr:lamin tail domain-containing protein [Chloroflexota bacterium]